MENLWNINVVKDPQIIDFAVRIGTVKFTVKVNWTAFKFK